MAHYLNIASKRCKKSKCLVWFVYPVASKMISPGIFPEVDSHRVMIKNPTSVGRMRGGMNKETNERKVTMMGQ